MNHLVQMGTLGWIGRFRAADLRRRGAGAQVICRTDRGLEVGRVLKSLPRDESAWDGILLRQTTPEDQLLLGRIERFRDQAFQACQKLLKQRGLEAILVDVEHLFDGQSLYFYFLGEVSDEVNELTRDLAETYEAKVRFRRFSQTLAEGCGPNCGSGDSGCGSGGCQTCSVKSACQTGRPTRGST